MLRIGSLIFYHPQIGVNHVLIFLNLTGQSLCNQAAKIQHVDPVGNVHDQVHVVLDEQDGQMVFVPNFMDKVRQFQGLLRIPAGKQTDSVEGYLVAEPIRSNLSIESMAAMLWFGLGVDYRQGESFIFISRNKQSLYALRWRAGGFDLLQRKRDRGKFRWPPAPGPEGASSLNPYVLEEVLSVLRQEASERKEFLGICENH